IPMPHPAICFGSARLYLGLLATTMGAWEDAEEHFRAAAEANQRLGATVFLARSYFGHARALALRGGPGDADRARRLLGRADALASSLGLVRLSREIDALRERPGRGAWEGWRAPLDGNGRLLLAPPTGRVLAPAGVR